jgi:hypothetical protein
MSDAVLMMKSLERIFMVSFFHRVTF